MKQQLLLAAVIAILIGAAGLGMSMTENDSMAFERLDNTQFENANRPAARFDHDLHNEQASLEDDCAVCHHVYEDGILIKDESSEDSRCTDCHGLKRTGENGVPLRLAYHKRCKDCHFNEKKGPVLCGECHINKGRSI